MCRFAAALPGAALCLSLALSLGCSNSPDTRPNVLLITVDTLRPDFLSSYGYELNTSPSMDSLAEDGVVFLRAIAAASSTAPSHASIMTSRYTREHSIGWRNGSSRLEDTTTLAEVFSDAGYATAAFVGNFVLRRRMGLDRGFGLYDDDLPAAEINRPSAFERVASQTTARALEWLQGLSHGPFFLWVHYQDPHGPYAPPSAHAGKFRLRIPPEEKPLPLLDNNSGYKGVPTYQVLEGLWHPSEYRGRYADEIFYADQWIGTLLDAVESHGSGREPVILLTSDHGESMGENDLYFVHAFTTTPGEAHVPMILRAPGLKAERRPELVSHVDIMPTLLEIAGLTPPNPMSGLALGPYLRESRPIPARMMYCDIGREVSAYQADGFVRVEWAIESQAEELGRERTWGAYSWRTDGSWFRNENDGARREEIQRYLQKVPPIVPAQVRDPGDIERLRALGYVDD